MRHRFNLRFRVALAFATLGALVSLLMASSQILATHDLGQRLIDETLNAELDDYFARRQRNPRSLPPSTITLHGYVQEKESENETIPKYLSLLLPGRHNLEVGALSYRVAVVDNKDARFFFLFDTTLQQRREEKILFFIGASIVIVVLISAMGGVWLVEIIIAPVTELAMRVRNRRPDVWTIQLDEDFSSDEVGELARAFNLHLARIHAFMEREQAFSSDLNHELRTSLAVILNAVEILLEDASINEKQKRRLLRI
ncbi:MAG TPA: histidine kinase, partial [Magnetococcales bacterium]|nr:histidine kinase [Magnetococcales bacterium]